MSHVVKPCQRKLCDRDAIEGELYCAPCRAGVLATLRSSGFLTPQVFGHFGDNRTYEQKELVMETKFGVWQ